MPTRKRLTQQGYDLGNIVVDEYVTRCVTIRKDQANIIDDIKLKGEKFKLSPFLQFHLDKFIGFRQEAEEFIDSCKEVKHKNDKK